MAYIDATGMTKQPTIRSAHAKLIMNKLPTSEAFKSEIRNKFNLAILNTFCRFSIK